MSAMTNSSADVRCPGCGKSFTGARGLRAHQHAKFVAMGCKPVAAPEHIAESDGAAILQTPPGRALKRFLSALSQT